VTALLDGIDLVVFDKDGTLIDFHAMWSGWATDLAARLETATGRQLRVPLYEMLGYDAATGRAIAHGQLAATPMARIRDLIHGLLVDLGLTTAETDAALVAAWHAPDPVELAVPLTDLMALFRSLRADGRLIAVATADDRDATQRSLAAVGVDGFLDAVACGDDGLATKPAPDMVLAICHRVGIRPERTAVVGDSIADLKMGRAAGVGRCIGVLTGVGNADDLAPYADVTLASVAELGPGRIAADGEHQEAQA
jgi:phosphoglycolate phosphatase